MLLEVTKFVWQVVLPKQEQDERRLCTQHENIDYQGAENSRRVFNILSEKYESSCSFRVKVRLTVLNDKY
jgi:hypothetical protein